MSRNLALDLTALFLIWLGTFILVIFAIPKAVGIPLFSGIDGATLLSPIDGAVLKTASDYALRWRYGIYAVPAMGCITVGMIWQAWRCYQADISRQASTPGTSP